MEINTKRLLLRNFRQEDFISLKGIVKEKQIIEYVPIVISNNDIELQENLDEYIDSHLNHYFIAIEEKESKKLIGMIICIPLISNDYDVSYLISRNHTNKGYCYEALKAVIKYFKNTHKNFSFIFSIDEKNIPSQKIMQKLNISRSEKKLRNHYIYKLEI